MSFSGHSSFAARNWVKTSPTRCESMSNLASAYHDAGRLDLAIPLLEATLDKRRVVLGEDHHDTIETMNDLAVAYWKDGQVSRAIPLYEATLAKIRVALWRQPDRDGHDHGQPGRGVRRRWQTRAGDPNARRRRWRSCGEKLGDEHPTTLITVNNLGRTYEAAGRIAEAIRLHERTLEKLRSRLTDDHPTTLTAMYGLAKAYRDYGQFEQGDCAVRDDAREAATQAGRGSSGYAPDPLRVGQGPCECACKSTWRKSRLQSSSNGPRKSNIACPRTCEPPFVKPPSCSMPAKSNGQRRVDSSGIDCALNEYEHWTCRRDWNNFDTNDSRDVIETSWHVRSPRARQEEEMLVLSRKLSQQVIIGSDVSITIVRIDRNQVRIGISAPPGVAILRKELLDKLQNGVQPPTEQSHQLEAKLG